MKTYVNKISFVSLAVALVIGIAGCSGGGGGGGTAPEVIPDVPEVIGSAVLSGTLAQSSSSSISAAPSRLVSALPVVDEDSSAELIIDYNRNGTFGDSKDLVYTSVVTDGTFEFQNLEIEKEGETQAQLTVKKDGFAPVVNVVTLSDGKSVSVIAEAGNLPVQTEVVKIDRTNPTFKSAYLRVGMKQTATGISSYAKIMSLSQLRAAAADPSFGESDISTSIIPLDSVPTSVTEIKAEMKAFDPTDEEDSKYFPGEYKGVGKTSGAQADEEPMRLVSVGFDLMSLTDQNGEDIELDASVLRASKLRPQAIDYDSCLQTKTRYLSEAQVSLIEKMGDDDNTTDAFEIPMWYYNNQSGMWNYLGEAEYFKEDVNNTRAYAKMCVTENWGKYLNLDYAFAIAQPKNVCVSARDQDGGLLSRMRITAKKETAYESKYLDANGEAKIALTAGDDLSEYEFSYAGAITRWTKIDVDSSEIVTSTADGCDYNLSLIVENPYTATLEVTAKDLVGDLVTSGYVYVTNRTSEHYFNTYQYLDSNGTARFSIKPNVEYKVRYSSFDTLVKSDNNVAGAETEDTNNYVAVNLQEVNKAPLVTARFRDSRISENATQARFYISAKELNSDDKLTFESLTLNGTSLVAGTHYTIDNERKSDKYQVMNAILDLNNAAVTAITAQGLNIGDYKLVATYSDNGGLSTSSDSTLRVVENLAPSVYGIYLRDVNLTNRTRLTSNHSIKAGTYTVHAYSYDPNGDDINTTYKLDNGAFEMSAEVLLTDGEHEITVKVSDGDKSAEKLFSIFVGNRAPKVTYSSASRYFIDLANPKQTKFYAYASDSEDARGTLKVQAVSSNGTAYDMAYSSYRYTSQDINLSMVGDYKFSIIATDSNDKNSTATELNVQVVDRTPNAAAKSVSVNDNTAVSGDINITSVGNATVRYTGDVVNGLVVNSDGTFTFDATTNKDLAVGEQRVIEVPIRVSNKYGNSSSSLTITVTGTNDAPVLTVNESSVNVAENGSIDIAYTVSDVDGDANVTASALNGVATVNASTVTYLATSESGTLTITATDDQGATDSATVTMLVIKDNLPPTISVAAVSVDGNSSVSGVVTFADSDSQVATLSIKDGLSVTGFTLNTTTGAYTYDSSSFAMLDAGKTQLVQIPLVVDDGELSSYAWLDITVNGVYINLNKPKTEEIVSELLEPTDTADVEDAKYMFAQLRETAVTFVDMESPETNASTIVGSQVNALKTKIEPAVMSMAIDFENSAMSIESSLNGFTSSIETDLNETVDSIITRVEGLIALIDSQGMETNWNAMSGDDNLSYTVVPNIPAGTATGTYTLDGKQMSFVADMTTMEPQSVSGSLILSGTNYDLNVSTLTITDGASRVVANGYINGANSASMTLTELDIAADVNTSIDNFNMMQNLVVTFDGTIVAGGRTLDGIITLNEGSPSVIEGSYAGTTNEPSFSGKATLKTSLNALLNDGANAEQIAHINTWSPLVMVRDSNGSESFVILYEQNLVDSNQDYNETTEMGFNENFYQITLKTQSGVDAVCNRHLISTYSNNEDSYLNEVTCENGANLRVISTDKDRVTAKVNGVEMIIESYEMQYVSLQMPPYYIYIPKISFRNNGEAYLAPDLNMMLNGEAVTISDVRVTPVTDLLDREFDLKFEGLITHTAKEVNASFGIDKGMITEIYVKNINITDGVNYIRANELNISMENSEFMSMMKDDNKDMMSPQYNEPSVLEDYNMTFNSIEYEEFRDEGPNPESILAVNASGLKLSILDDTESSTLTVDADLALTNNTMLMGVFDGEYNYNGAKFVGHIDVNGSIGMDTAMGEANVFGSVESYGFIPFDITANVKLMENESAEGYIVFSRGEDYELGIKVTNERVMDVNSSTETITVNLGDSNGVLGEMIETTEFTPMGDNSINSGLIVTDKNGRVLAEVDSETLIIDYDDNTSETLY